MSLVPTDEAVRSDATLDGVLIPMKTPSGGSIGILVTHEVLDEDWRRASDNSGLYGHLRREQTLF